MCLCTCVIFTPNNFYYLLFRLLSDSAVTASLNYTGCHAQISAMDDDSCSKFIGSLTKYLQSLCHSYVDFDNGVELVGHLYLRVDTGKKKIDYVLNESVCKNGSNVVKFTSNSYHAQPVEKKEKEPPKKTPDPPKSTAEGKRADDDVIIVGSEASRRRRSGSSSSQGLPSQSQGTRTGGQPGMGQPQGGMFRHPRGPNPRMATHGLRTGAYPYQPRFVGF